MNLFSQSGLARSKLLSNALMIRIKPLQSGLTIAPDIETGSSQGKAVQNVFQRPKGGKTLYRKVSHSLSRPYLAAKSGIRVSPSALPAFRDRAERHVWLARLSMPRPSSKLPGAQADRRKCRCIWSPSQSPADRKQPLKCRKIRPVPGWTGRLSIASERSKRRVSFRPRPQDARRLNEALPGSH